MDFSFPKEYELLRRMIREFAQNEVAPIAEEIDRDERVPWETIKKAAKLGLMGVPFPQEYGGAGAGEIGYCILMEEINKVCGSTATVIGAHTGIGAMAIYLDGTEEQKKKYLTPLARGEKIAAFALTEPNAGSDAASIQTRAIRDGDYFILNGSKLWITNGDIADILTVMAVTDPALGARGGVTAFIVEKDFPGFIVGTIEEKMGIRGSSTAELFFEDCRVPKENVLGQFGAGFLTFMKTLDIGRLSLGAGCLGAADAALEMSMDFAKNRYQFGAPIAHKQAIQWMIADMATEIEALRSLVYRTAWMVDTGQINREFSTLAAICKLYGSEVLGRCVDKAVQIHGGMGYMKKYPIERMYRDARITRIFEGTSEVQRDVIARNLFRKIGLRIR
ncbi:MAG: acyl-CoA dehydrogenase family protein [Chloroflexota bacterium]|nr:acyl-CoA dehydrogenase family protein [Anaerolineae bacterium]